MPSKQTSPLCKPTRKAVLHLLKKAPLCAAGSAIAALGLTINAANMWGSDSMNTFFNALAAAISISIGDVYTLFNGTFLILGFLFARKNMGIGSLVQVLFLGGILDFWTTLLGRYPFLFAGTGRKTLAAALGFVLYCFGNALFIAVRFGIAGYESFLFKLSDRILVEYRYLKMASDLMFFLGALALRGVFGVMTIVYVCLYGPVTSQFIILINHTLLKRTGLFDDRNELYKNSRRYRSKQAQAEAPAPDEH